MFFQLYLQDIQTKNKTETVTTKYGSNAKVSDNFIEYDVVSLM